MKTAILLLASLPFTPFCCAQDHKALQDAKGPPPFVAPAGEEDLTKLIDRCAAYLQPDEVLARPDLRVPVTVALKLEHTNAMVATNALRPFFASNGSPAGGMLIGNAGNNTAMLLSGMQDQVVQAIRIVRACDVAGGKEWFDIEQRLASIAARLDALEGKKADKTDKK